jgi:hypothetical protein
MNRFVVSLTTSVLLLTTGCGSLDAAGGRAGRAVRAADHSQLPLVRDAEINRYINLLGDSIARVADRRDLDWHFFVVDTPRSTPSRYGGLHLHESRLIERAQNMAQVAGVLGHEIGHVTERHSVQQMQKAQARRWGSRWDACSRRRSATPGRLRGAQPRGETRCSPSSAAATRPKPIAWGSTSSPAPGSTRAASPGCSGC